MVAATKPRPPSVPPHGPTTIPPKPEQGRRVAQDRLHLRKLLAHPWRTIEAIGQTAFREHRCPATGQSVEECPGCRGPRLAEAPPDGALPHYPAVLAYLEEQARKMRELLDLHQYVGR